MRSSKSVCFGFFMASLALVGCDGSELDLADDGLEGYDEDPSFRAEKDNSESLAGAKLNGTALSSLPMSTQGTVQGNRLLSVQIPGHAASGVARLEQASGELILGLADGGELRGLAVKGATFAFDTDGDARADLRLMVAGAARNASEAVLGGEIWEYRLTQTDALGVASRVCGDATVAVFVDGDWDASGARGATGDFADGSDTMTIACSNTAIAKCAYWGYRPTDAAGEAYHQTCTRMVRADYRYDGASRTMNGTTIWIKDRLGINEQASQSGVVKEAEWGVDGLLCVNRAHFRQPTRVLPECPEGDLEQCYTIDPDIPDCAEDEDLDEFERPGALFMTGVAAP